MRLVLAALAAAAVLATTSALPSALPSLPDPRAPLDAQLASLASAFARDGFRVVSNISYAGRIGVRAASLNVTLLKTGAPKSAFFVQGSGYEMGFLLGQLAAPETETMATTYLTHIVPSLLDPTLDEELSNNATTAPVYDLLCGLLADLLVKDANAAFASDLATGIIPSNLVDELHGLADGANAAGAADVTYEKLVTLNYGMDWISAMIYSGQILNIFKAKLATFVAAGRTTPALAAITDSVIASRPNLVQVQAYCDAFAARGSATASGSGSFFARDFQLPTAQVFQDINAPVIYQPIGDGRHALVAATAPGFVGAMTAMNDAGVVMGVDTLRSGDGNATRPGLNSLLLVRATVHASATSEEATEFVANAVRGLTWLHPLSDASGDGRILETGQYRDSNVPFDFAAQVEDPKLRALLPNASYVAAHSPVDYRHGIYVRHMNYSYPSAAFVDAFNADLFAYAGLTYEPARFVPGQLVFDNFTYENSLWFQLGDRFFPPSRFPTGTPAWSQDVIFVSNFALTPQLRLSEMTFWAGVIPDQAMQWRYDTLSGHVYQAAAAGSIDFAVSQRLITFLQPCASDNGPGPNDPPCTVGYWKDRLNATDPLSALIEGSIAVCDLQARVMAVRAGYWRDGWLTLTLPNYLS